MSRSHVRFSRTSAVAIAAAVAFQSPLASAQETTKTVLPEISVTTQKPIPAAKPKKVAKAKAPAEPVPAAEPVDASAAEPAATVNAGTPSASVAPVMGAAGAPVGQTATSIDTTRVGKEPVFSVLDVLRESPGVSMKQGNGPRDIGISIRGSNARNGFGIRNIVIMEDGFVVTQPDGLSRSDLIDPHAYSGIDVWRGPSSALFGNYATGGAINFRSKRGGEINGIEYGTDVGSFGYLNNYVAAGTKTATFEGSVFLSDVRGDGHYGYSEFDTQTVNMLLTYQATSKDTITIKGINNELDTELPFRMSLNQFKLNPNQKGCEKSGTQAQNTASGCQASFFSRTGNTGVGSSDRVLQTAEQAGANRGDRRTIGGFRWEHDFDAATTGRVQFVIDDRNISQPTGTTSAVGDYLSYNVIADLSHRASFAGLPSTYSLATFWNYLPVEGYSYNVAPGGGAALGLLQSKTTGSTTNFGMRFREEVTVTNMISVALGANVEKTLLDGAQRSYTYNTSGVVQTDRTVTANRELTNIAPELSILVKPNEAWQVRGRIGTGYGTPQFSNLFVTPAGTPGNNTELDTQENVGFDLGTDWTPVRGVSLSVTGFYEFFRNELVSQSAGPGLLSYTFNAPRSEHRGIEAEANVTITDGLRFTAAYILNDQYYTEYQERLSGSATLFDRKGNKIPGVSPQELTARLAYDQPTGTLKGLGAFVEYQWHEGFYMENQNLLEAPGYDLVNLNVHYQTEFTSGPVKSLMAYFEVRNVLDETYISAANNITNSVGNTAASLANVAGTIYSGDPRTYYGGVKIKF